MEVADTIAHAILFKASGILGGFRVRLPKVESQDPQKDVSETCDRIIKKCEQIDESLRRDSTPDHRED